MKSKDEFFDILNKKIQAGIATLPDKPEESSETTLKALWCLAAGKALSVERAMTESLPDLTDEETVKLETLVEKRLTGTPLAHITERQNFMGVELLASDEALVPRKETELVGYAALRKLNECFPDDSPATVIDVCTGSGNLAVALAHTKKNIKMYGSDLSSSAVTLAKKNAKYLGLESVVSFFVGDLFEPFESDDFYNNVDVLTCNPPYISSGKLESMPGEIINHEPELAFNGGPFGIKILNKLLKEAPKFIKNNGWLAFEVGLGQGEPLLKRIEKNINYSKSETVEDANGDVRAILLQVTKPS